MLKYVFVFSLLLCIACDTKKPLVIPESLVNPAHLNRLYETIVVNGDSMGIIHIYSNYPDYHWVWEDHEGIACVDDVARAAIFYAQYYAFTKKSEYLEKAKKLTEFLLFMQADNGYYYNFIYDDYRINKEYHRSKPVANWWTWRALWALSELHKIVYFEDKPLADRIRISMSRTIDTVKKEFSPHIEYQEIEGFNTPKWLPGRSGADQGATLVLGLSDYYVEYPEKQLLDIMQAMCSGIIHMQAGDSSLFPHYAFLSWRNNWHAWGNIQAYVLLRTYPILHEMEYYLSARKEIDHFFEYLIKHHYSSEFSLKKNEATIITIQSKQAPQIAYGIRPMVYACLEAYKMSKDTNYAGMAGKIGGWLFGDNFSGKKMYDPDTGICYDGINVNGEVNKNSGAESTIEALLTLLFIEKVPAAKKVLMEYFLKHVN